MSKPDKRPVHIAEIKKTYKGKVHVSTYLRRTFREDGKVKHETVANISDLPDDLLAVEVFPGNTADPKAFILCMLAYNVEWHMRDALCELIFDDDDIEAAQATRRSVVAKAKRSESAKQKDATRRTPEDLPVQSFQDLLKDMGTLTRNRIRFESSASEFNQLTESTTLQRRVLDLLSTHA